MSWQDKANKIISQLCYESYCKANTTKGGKVRKRHVPYSVPALALTLLECIKKNDEATAKDIFIKLAIVPESIND